MIWSELTDKDRFELVSQIFLAELKTFHFTSTEDDFINTLMKACINNISAETKEHLGGHLNLIVSAYANESKDHTVLIGQENPIPKALLNLNGCDINLTLTESGYIRHMIHAICNNIVLMLMIFSSSLHSVIPGIQPFWCVDRLIQIFINMRIHTHRDVLQDRYTHIINNMQSSRTGAPDENLEDINKLVVSSLFKEKDILSKLLPEEFIKHIKK